MKRNLFYTSFNPDWESDSVGQGHRATALANTAVRRVKTAQLRATHSVPAVKTGGLSVHCHLRISCWSEHGLSLSEALSSEAERKTGQTVPRSVSSLAANEAHEPAKYSSCAAVRRTPRNSAACC